MAKVYFACSIRGGGDKSNYQAIVDAIKNSEAICLSEIFVNDALLPNGSPLPEEAIYARDISWIKEADAIIAEVTNPSLGVGYELAYAESLGKPVLTLFNIESGKQLSAMVAGNANFKNASYSSVDDLASSIQTFLQSIR